MDAKEEVRSRINIEDVIGEYVQLKRAGRNFKGLSPFSQEKSASFMVSPEKHIWHDFSSGRGGDVFSFVMEMEGVDFKGALELLARKAGVDLAQFRTGDGSLSKKKERLFAACDLAAKYYQQSLLRNKPALEYVFKKRGLNRQVVQDFMIGYSPQTDGALYAALTKRGFTERELRDAGLVVSRRFGPGDMFRGRMMVALADAQGRVVGFTARILADDPNAPKYINTPQTLLYDKSRHVFGLHLAKEAIRQTNFAVIVEGNMDVITSHQADVKNVVATAGTALTEHHLRTLSRFTGDVRLAFDADKAGIAATERAISIASNLGINLGIITLPDGVAKDADELIKKDVTLWQQAIAAPQDAVEWLLGIYATRYNLQTADGKRRATDQALDVVRHITDPVLLEHYVGKISERVGSSQTALNKKLSQQPAPAQKVLRQPQTAPKTAEPENRQTEDSLLALAWAHPQLRDSLRQLPAATFSGPARQAIATYIMRLEGKADSNQLQSDEERVKIGEIELIAEAKFPQLTDELYFMAADFVKRIKKEQKQTERHTLAHQFANTDDNTLRKQLNARIKQLDQEIEALKH